MDCVVLFPIAYGFPMPATSKTLTTTTTSAGGLSEGLAGRFSRALRRFLLGANGGTGFEHLETRQLLAGTPLPTLASLESQSNSVVRIETNYGDIDIELFDSQAPVTVANFLNYVRTGRFDETFFHRSVTSPNPFVLQGGGFIYDDVAGFSAVSTDAPIIREATGRLNLARTLAMARTDDINSATSQFFINYVDNAFLDPTGPNNGYAVFGKVIQGWNVVTTIQALSVQNFSTNPIFAGANASAMGEVPVGSSYAGTVREQHLVTITNAEILKVSGVAGFFDQRLVMPEGFNSSTSREILTISNPNPEAAAYQVIARYESGSRDRVISNGILQPNSSLSTVITSVGDGLVRQGAYSIVVESASPASAVRQAPITAEITREDFGSAGSEGLVAISDLTNAQLQTWDFPAIQFTANSADYLTFYNNSDQVATVTTTFRTNDGSTLTVIRTIEPYRRRGIYVAEENALNSNILSGTGAAFGTNRNISARVTSNQPIVAALADYDTPSTPGLLNAYTPGWLTMGVLGGGSTEGGIGAVSINTNTNSNSTLSILNSNSSNVTVRFDFWRNGRLTGTSPVSDTEIVPSGRYDYDLSQLAPGIARGESFSVTYTVTSGGNISVMYVDVSNEGRGQTLSGGATRDGLAEAFLVRAPRTQTFRGETNPSLSDAQDVETLSIFNPDLGDSTDYTVRYLFSDGTVLTTTGTLARGARQDIVTRSLPNVKNKINSDPTFRRYAIEVTGTYASGSSATPSGVRLASLTRTSADGVRSIQSNGSWSDAGLAMTDASLNGAG